jgi:hypothetical protein
VRWRLQVSRSVKSLPAATHDGSSKSKERVEELENRCHICECNRIHSRKNQDSLFPYEVNPFSSLPEEVDNFRQSEELARLPSHSARDLSPC